MYESEERGDMRRGSYESYEFGKFYFFCSFWSHLELHSRSIDCGSLLSSSQIYCTLLYFEDSNFRRRNANLNSIHSALIYSRRFFNIFVGMREFHIIDIRTGSKFVFCANSFKSLISQIQTSSNEEAPPMLYTLHTQARAMNGLVLEHSENSTYFAVYTEKEWKSFERCGKPSVGGQGYWTNVWDQIKRKCIIVAV